MSISAKNQSPIARGGAVERTELLESISSRSRSRSGPIIDARSRFGDGHPKAVEGRRLRILIVTPEIAYLPEGMASPTPNIAAKAGGLADVAALLVEALGGKKVDVHVALPHYRRMFGVDPSKYGNRAWNNYKLKRPDSRVHLAEDPSFYYRDRIYGHQDDANLHGAIAFQREVINNILPRVQPDIVHCHDWTTGLIPAAARRLNIPSLFTVHNIHTERVSLAHMEHLGIDTAEFWDSLYFDRHPECYQETREHNPADLLASGILASDLVNTVSPTFLDEIVSGHHDFVPDPVRRELGRKKAAGHAYGILNTPDPSCDPSTDWALPQCYTPECASLGKTINKRAFQEETGLKPDPEAPLFFWPSRLDPVQKGCQLVSDVLHRIVSRHWDSGIQFAFVADGPAQHQFHHIADCHGIRSRVAVCDFREQLSRLGYAASDFTLMPSRFEPCGLSQMIAVRYGSLPLVRDTGGLSDTITHLDPNRGTGNGFVFEDFDTSGLSWAVDEAMRFFSRDRRWRDVHVDRVMRESREMFDSEKSVSQYLSLYELLEDWRGAPPVVSQESDDAHAAVR